MSKRILLLIGLLLVAFFELRQLLNNSSNQPIVITKEATATAKIIAGEIATVAFVVDGDTIELTDGRRVRYIGIDAPEYNECYGQEAKEENNKRVNEKSVRLEKDISDTDSYGRLLRYVYSDGDFVNEQLVKGGFAYAWNVPPDEKYKEALFVTQQESKNATLGIWQACRK